MRVAITTIGCKVNVYDSEAIAELFKQSGHEVVEFNTFADVYIVNTCTVTSLSDKKSRQALGRAKKRNPNAIIVATGCYAQTASSELNAIADIIIGTSNRSEIVKMVEARTKSICIIENRSQIDFEQLNIKTQTNRSRAFMKIQEGCDEFCSYCIIPYARGIARSRPINDILNEAKELIQGGYKEIVLTGINVCAYSHSQLSLLDVIERLHDTDIKRIRLSSISPKFITNDFVIRARSLSKLCPHFHMSLQSGNDNVLRDMNRGYTTHDFETVVYKLREIYDEHVSLTTDVIVGFPGETDEYFEDTCEFVKRVAFSRVHVFPYSSRKNTVACSLKNHVPNEIKKSRANKLIAIAKSLSDSFMTKNINKTHDVLVEDDYGYTKNYIKVKTQGLVPNSIVQMQLIKTEQDYCIGELKVE